MGGALRARAERFEADRTLALMTAYFSGMLAQAEWKKMPAFGAWLNSLTKPPRANSNAEIIARFEAMAAAGFDVTVN